jgi:hypothetical protein
MLRSRPWYGWLALGAIAGCATSAPLASSAAPEAPPGITYAGGDGLSCPTRILIKGANFETGIEAEYAWLRAKYPGFTRGTQTLIECDGKPSDRIEIVTESGLPLVIHFDVSEFFGKGL